MLRAAFFLEDSEVQEIIKSLGISVLAAPQPRGAKLAKPKIDKLETRKALEMATRLQREGTATPLKKMGNFVQSCRNKIFAA